MKWWIIKRSLESWKFLILHESNFVVKWEEPSQDNWRIMREMSWKKQNISLQNSPSCFCLNARNRNILEHTRMYTVMTLPNCTYQIQTYIMFHMQIVHCGGQEKRKSFSSLKFLHLLLKSIITFGIIKLYFLGSRKSQNFKRVDYRWIVVEWDQV